MERDNGSTWRACPRCHALCPEGATFCPNCAPRGAAWQRWFRTAAAAAGVSVLGAASGCCYTAVEVDNPDSGLVDAGVPDGGVDAGLPDSGVDAGLADAGLADAGVVKCFCPIAADYGLITPCDEPPSDLDAGCPFGEPMCMLCP